MATILFGVSNGNWTDGTKWIGGTAPTAADDASFSNASANVTIDSGAVCRSVDFSAGTTYSGTVTHTAAVTLTIGDATAGAGSVALKMVAGMTYTLGSVTTSAISFISTSSTQQTVDFAGKSCGNLTFNAASNGKWAITTGLVQNSTASVTFTAGTLEMDGTADSSALTHSIGIFTSIGSATRVLTMGASSTTCTFAGIAWNVTALGLTFQKGTSTITCNGAAGSFTSAGGVVTYNNVLLTGSGLGYANCSNGTTFVNLTRTGTATTTDIFQTGSNFIVTGTLTISGNSATNRMLVQAVTIGTQLTITAAAGALISNADFRDIKGAGAFGWDLSAITGLSGDCGGNSTITFTTAATQTFSGTISDSWSTNAWTSRVPLPQDNVVINAAFSASQTVTGDMPRLGKAIDWTGATGSPTWSLTVTGNTMYGSLTLISAMTLTVTQAMSFESRSSISLTSAGKTWTTFNISLFASTFTLNDAFSSSSTVTLPSPTTGSFNANNFNMTASQFKVFSVGGVITMGSGTWTLTSAGSNTALDFSAVGLTINANTSTISVTNTGAGTKTLALGTYTYNNIAITGGGSGAIIFTGASSINRITVIGGTKSITLPGSTTITLRSSQGLGNGTNVITFTASAGSATLSKSSSVVNWNYVSLTNIPSTGGATFYAGANSTNGGGNTGWLFSNAPTPKGNLGTRVSIGIGIRI